MGRKNRGFAWLSLAVLLCAIFLMPASASAAEVRVMGFHFDPLAEGEPELPQHLRAPSAGPGFRLVQLSGTTRSQWLDEITGSGQRVLQYYPHDTFLVWSGGNAESALAGKPFVRWQGAFHPAYKIHPSLTGRSGRIDQVDVMFYEDGDAGATLRRLEALGAEIVLSYPSQPDRAFWNAIVKLDGGAIEAVAQLPTVLWLGYQSPKPVLDDEMSSQIVAGNHPGGIPETGYFAWLSTLGYDGTGVVWSITDTGVDYTHPDLASRIVGGHNYPGCSPANPGDDPSTGGHGTHVAGIVGGNATGGFTDANGFLYGLGVAPGYGIFAQNPICGTQSSWPPAGGWQELSKRGVLGSAIGANNSWTSGEGINHGYQATERTHDFMVRDGNFDTAATAESYVLVFSAGNSGSSPSTLTSPKEAKNVIVTAGTQNYRVSSNIEAMYSSSSRGPAVDGRIVPTIAAPGQQIASTRNNDGGLCASSIAGTSGLYSFCTGTSMAAPHAAGSVVLITDWWRGFHAGRNPSPAMAKALLINGAVDITGAPSIPNFSEGWGRVNLQNVIDTGIPTFYHDQSYVFGAPGQQRIFSFDVDDVGLPLKCTLAWSDAPGAVGANPALVNNLDLSLTTDGNTYLGNRFTSGWSTTGGSADNLNNVENVFVQTPGTTATLTLTATNLPGDGVPIVGDTTDQDFALVCTNVNLPPIFSDGFESGDTSAWSAIVP